MKKALNKHRRELEREYWRRHKHREKENWKTKHAEKQSQGLARIVNMEQEVYYLGCSMHTHTVISVCTCTFIQISLLFAATT